MSVHEMHLQRLLFDEERFGSVRALGLLFEQIWAKGQVAVLRVARCVRRHRARDELGQHCGDRFTWSLVYWSAYGKVPIYCIVQLPANSYGNYTQDDASQRTRREIRNGDACRTAYRPTRRRALPPSSRPEVEEGHVSCDTVWKVTLLTVPTKALHHAGRVR